MKKDKRPQKRSKRALTKARNTQVIADSMLGKSRGELTAKYDLNKDQVSRILNGAEAQAFTKRCVDRLTLAGDRATDRLLSLIDDPDSRVALEACKTILKSNGAIREKVEMTHSFPKPTIIQRIDGTTIILGSIEDAKT